MTSLILCSLPSGAVALLGNEHKINDVIMASRSHHMTSSSSLFATHLSALSFSLGNISTSMVHPYHMIYKLQARLLLIGCWL